MPGTEEVSQNSRQQSRWKRLVQRKIHETRSAVGPCTKYTLFFVNFIFVICGAALTALGAYILVLKVKQVHNALDFFLDPACDMCLAGAIMFTLAFLGALGALREITCCLKFYYAVMCLFLLGEITLAVMMFTSYYVPDVKSAIFPTDTFKQAVQSYRDDPDMQLLIDTLQRDLECCGWSEETAGYLDWNENVYFNCSKSNESPERCSVPYSCCKTNSGDKINYNCGKNVVLPSSSGPVENAANIYRINKDGCIKALGDWINENSLIIGGVTLGIILPQIFIIVLARNLIDMINYQKSKWYM